MVGHAQAVRAHLCLAAELMVFRGIPPSYRDVSQPINQLAGERAPLEAIAEMRGFALAGATAPAPVASP